MPKVLRNTLLSARDLLVRKYGIQFRILQLIQFLGRARPAYFELSLAK